MKRISWMFLIIVLWGSAIFTQSRAELEVIAKIREEGYQNSQVMDIASYITDIHGNRLTGSMGIKEA